MKPEPRSLPSVSVVVPVERALRSGIDTVRSLLDQAILPDEIVLVAGSESECAAARELGQSGVDVRCVVGSGRGVSRMRALTETTGELVAFLDGDCVASARWIEAIVDAYRKETGAQAIGGRIALRWGAPRPAWSASFERYYGAFDLGDKPRDMTFPLVPDQSNFAVARSALRGTDLLTAGSSREPAGRSSREEPLFEKLAQRNLRVVYEPGALVYRWVEAGRLSPAWALRRGFVEGRARARSEAAAAEPLSRIRRLGRSADEFAGAAVATAVALADGRGRPHALALIQGSMRLGSAVEELELAMRPLPPTMPSR